MSKLQLVQTEDILKIAKLNKLGPLGIPIAWSMKNISGLSKANKIYSRGCEKNTSDFLAFVLEDLNINFELYEEDLKRIPKEGPFVITSNHPLGAMDGILMMHIVSKIRPDFKIMGNFLLHKIKPLEPMVIAVNPFETRKEAFNSNNGIREAIKHIQSGGCLGIFPSGEVSSKDKDGNIIDREWQKPAIKLIKKLNVPVVPMYFHCKNSDFFYRMAKLHPTLQTALLPKEAVRTRIKPIHIRIGKPISVKQQEIDDLQKFSDFLRKKTYSLSNYYSKKKLKLIKKLKIPKQIHINSKSRKPKAIIDETPKNLLIAEINELRSREKKRMFVSNNYECYFAKAKEIPGILREIGRLRELTYREVGEGTNQEIDLDRYDVHYNHLFLWDTETDRIVGAYRMALGKKVFERYGSEGFYMNELFHFDAEFKPFFTQCIEMGRAFVVSDYQQKPMPLFLLWRGVVHVTLRNPSHKYIIGSVSISNRFSDFSKSLMVEFMKSHYYDPYVAQFIRAKNEFKIKLKDEDKEFFLGDNDADLNKFDKLIDELEPSMRLPVLAKKYIKQNARVIGFNVDPKFNDAIDGLMYIRISNLPESTVKPVFEELQAEIYNYNQ